MLMGYKPFPIGPTCIGILTLTLKTEAKANKNIPTIILFYEASIYIWKHEYTIFTTAIQSFHIIVGYNTVSTHQYKFNKKS